MTTARNTTTGSALVQELITPDFDSFGVRRAIVGFLAGFGDSTRAAYSLDLRQWMCWCAAHELDVLAVRRDTRIILREERTDAKALTPPIR